MKQGQRWDIDDYILLCNMWKCQCDLAHMSIELQRSAGSIVHRLNEMHLVKYDSRDFSYYYKYDGKNRVIFRSDIRAAEVKVRARLEANEKPLPSDMPKVSQISEASRRPNRKD